MQMEIYLRSPVTCQGESIFASPLPNLYYQVVTTHIFDSEARKSSANACAMRSRPVSTKRVSACPSESELVKTFGASRPTVNRALRELQLAGIIERRAGSGSYVRADTAARGYTFGLVDSRIGPDGNLRADMPGNGRGSAQRPSRPAVGKFVGRIRRTSSSRRRKPAGSS